MSNSIEAKPDTPLITMLNETRGVVPIDFVPVAPETRINIVTLAGRIGVAMSPHMSASPEYDETLGIGPADILRADFDKLEPGIIITPDNPLYNDAKNNRIALMPTLPLTILGQPGVQLPNVGVALGPGGEYPVIQTHPKPLAARARAGTLDALEEDLKLGVVTREAARETALRASGHALESKMAGLRKLETRYLGQQAVLWSLARDSRHVWRTAYLGKNLNRKRVEGEEIIHEFVEIAANNLGYGTKETNASHRVFTHYMHRAGSAREISQSWLSITKWAVLLINAKRGKVNQAMNACERAIRPYQPHLDKKQQLKAA